MFLLTCAEAVGCGAARYVSVMGNHIINPVITPSGASGTVTGVLAAGLVGPDYHLSPVWTPINMQLGAGNSLYLFRFIYMSHARADVLTEWPVMPGPRHVLFSR